MSCKRCGKLGLFTEEVTELLTVIAAMVGSNGEKVRGEQTWKPQAQVLAIVRRSLQSLLR